MLSPAANEYLTQTSKGTPMGELMRRYWQPIAASGELADRPTKQVKLMGEELVLYRDRSGTLGLIDRRCPHRRVDLSYGIPEEHGLRCMYHGWMMDETGQCIEQPFEETVHPDGRFKEKVKVAGYPVRELGGLIFAYLGPAPAPELPMWEPLVADNVARDIAISVLPCNWVQCQENSLDAVHTEWLHGNYSTYLDEVMGLPEDQRRPKAKPHLQIAFTAFEYGIIKRRIQVGDDTDSDMFHTGHPVLFPNILQVGSPQRLTMQFRVPMDDEHTLHISVYTFRAAEGKTVPAQDPVPYWYVPLQDAEERFIVNRTFNQDYMAWATQGPIARRDLEKLGESDVGIILFRRQLMEQVRLMEDGADPMNVFRKPMPPIMLPVEPSRGAMGRGAKYIPSEAGESNGVEDVERVLATYL